MMGEQAPIVWGSINIGCMPQWYEQCLRYMLKCDHVPRLAVVLEAEPLEVSMKKKLQDSTKGIMEWIYISHGMPTIENMNNDNARNLRHLIPAMYNIARDDDTLALIEQDVMVVKKDWYEETQLLLGTHQIVTSAGSYHSKITAITRRDKPKPYFSIFRREQAINVADAIKTNRGSFVTINMEDVLDDPAVYRLDKHKNITGKSHAFGTQDELWAMHARGGTNHDGRIDTTLKFFSDRHLKALIRKMKKKW